nr:ribonuclease H-like domain-containing protein [Tanacetum cinerariifolium]
QGIRVFNSITRIIQETLHVNFMENKPNVAGFGPAWLFDIDSLSHIMNYHPVLTENQSNPTAGFQDTDKAGEEGTHTYVLFSVLSDGSTNPKITKMLILVEMCILMIFKSLCLLTIIPTITRFRDLNEEFAECINNSSNVVSAAGPSVSAAGLDFTNSTNDFTVAGPLVSSAEQNFTNNTNDFSVVGPSNAAMPNLEDL